MRYLNDKAYNWSYWYSEGVYIKLDLDTVPVNITEKMFPSNTESMLVKDSRPARQLEDSFLMTDSQRARGEASAGPSYTMGHHLAS